MSPTRPVELPPEELQPAELRPCPPHHWAAAAVTPIKNPCANEGSSVLIL